MYKISVVEAVRKLAFKLNVTFNESVDCGYFSFDNKLGKGSVRGTRIFFGLEVLSFDVILNESITFDYLNLGETYLHCIFLQEGNLEHTFQHSSNTNKASRFQNVIVGSTSEDFSSLSLPANTKLKLIIITLERSSEIGDARGRLQKLLNDVLESLSVDNSFNYFGNFSSKASTFVDTIISSIPNNLNKRLLIEASVLNILYCQFINHEQDAHHDTNNSGLSKSEISNVIQLSEYITNNLDQSLNLTDLEKESGLNQKRIQLAFQHFFGMSVNKYIVNLKILKAKELIEKTELSISEIVYAIGLNSRSYFSRIFSNKYGLLPNEYRKYVNIHNPTYELSYFSEAKNDLTKCDFNNILEQSRSRNKNSDITGCLLYHKQNFFQILEGPKSEVLSIYNLILKDSRHTGVTKLYEGIKSGRTFDQWNMAFLEKTAFLNLSASTDFKLMNIELILEVSKIDPAENSNKLRTKLMWERARNAILVANDKKKSLNILYSE